MAGSRSNLRLSASREAGFGILPVCQTLGKSMLLFEANVLEVVDAFNQMLHADCRAGELQKNRGSCLKTDTLAPSMRTNTITGATSCVVQKA